MANESGLPDISTPAIPLSVSSGKPIVIKHGFGRQVVGWMVVWQTAPVSFSIVDPKADTSRELALMPQGSADVRLLLL